jgi:hypothetical protein
MDEMTNQRLDRLERECHRLTRQARHWKLVGCMALIGVGVLAICGANQDKPAKSVEAEHFVLRDNAGKRRGVLEVNGGGLVVLSLSDKDEKPRAFIALANDGSPILSLLDEQGRQRVSLNTSKDFGGSVVNLMDMDGKIRLGMAVRDDGGVPTLDLRDKDEKRRIILGMMPDGSGTLDFNGENESLRIRIGLGRDLPRLLFFDKQASPRLGMVVSPTGMVGLDVLTEEKRMSLGLEATGKMSLRIIDNKTDKAIFQTPNP